MRTPALLIEVGVPAAEGVGLRIHWRPFAARICGDPCRTAGFRSCYALRSKDSEHLTMRNLTGKITHRCSPALPARKPRKTASMAVNHVGCAHCRHHGACQNGPLH